MFHLLFALQEIQLYKNVVKCKQDDSLKNYSFANKEYLLYDKCVAAATEDESAPVPIYCYSGCNEAECADVNETGYKIADGDALFPVDKQFIISFGSARSANDIKNAFDFEDVCVRGDVALSGATGEKKTFYLITCIMFWVAFLLIVATFVLAVISISNCGCCRCCGGIKSIFPMKSTVGSA